MFNSGRYFIGDASVVLTPDEVKHINAKKDGFTSLPDGTTVYKCGVSQGIYRTSLGNSITISEIQVLLICPMLPRFNYTEYIRKINLYGMNQHFPNNFKPEMVNGDLVVSSNLTIDLNNDGMYGGQQTGLENPDDLLAKILDIEKSMNLK